MSPSILVIADTDSYLKWGAALASQLPDGWAAGLVVLRTPAEPSPRQQRVALSGTRFTPFDIRTVELAELDELIDTRAPDVVLLAMRGPLVRVVAPVVGQRRDRPVLVSGFPGLTIPAEPKAIVYREQVDLIVLHSRREVREFRANAGQLGVETVAFGLATLPFLRSAARQFAGSAREPDGTSTFHPDRTDLVFAAQAKVPAERDERVQVLRWLTDAARRRPQRRIIVKVRARAGEAQTHAETYDYAELLADAAVRSELGGTLPANLVVEDGPMAEHLARASALVTVSSTAVLEAVAEGVPALVIDEFGVAPKLINTVFEGSGLFGGAEALVAGETRHPDPAWLDDNYFHGSGADDWIDRLEVLVARRRAAGLVLAARSHNLTGGALRRAFERKRMLGAYDRSFAGSAAMVVAVPTRWCVRRARRLRALFVQVTPQATGAAAEFSIDGRRVLLDVPEV